MDRLIELLKPLFLPLLKLRFEPPHLPEGTSLVRALKPSPNWLAYRSLVVLFGYLNQLVGVAVACIALVARLGTTGWILTGVLAAIELVVIGFALVVTRIDYELRHYLVGDRSLRVVQGAWRREEVTLSYANIQNLEVTQGPIERLFGIKSLSISTAGSDRGPGEANGHLVTLVGLLDAEDLRTLILSMLRRQKGLGLGNDAPLLAPALDPTHLSAVRDAAVALREAARTHTRRQG